MNAFENKVYSTIKKYTMLSDEESVVVGLSGGADSVALISVLKKLGYNVCAVHINHLLRGSESDRDEKFVSDFCDNNHIKLYTYRVNVSFIASSEHISEEVAGRNVRYEYFKKVCDKEGIKKIAVAHNKNDNFETMIFNMARGTALKGISGISPVNDNIIRPLIDVDRYEIEDYLKENNLSFVTDSTNLENKYSRNIIRNLIVPKIKEINPNCISNAKRCSDIIREEDEFLDLLTNEFIKSNVEFFDNEIKLKLLSDTNIVILRRAICKCISYITKDELPISFSYIDSILKLSSNGKKFNIGDKLNVIKNYDTLSFSPLQDSTEDFEYIIKDYDDLFIKEIGETLTFEIVSVKDMDRFDNTKTYLDADKVSNVIIRNRRVGDRFVPSGMTGSKKLKDFFCDNKVLSQDRKRIPLVISQGKIACVVGMRVAQEYIVDSDTQNVLCISKNTLY